jgi:hypothetical protein
MWYLVLQVNDVFCGWTLWNMDKSRVVYCKQIDCSLPIRLTTFVAMSAAMYSDAGSSLHHVARGGWVGNMRRMRGYKLMV